MIFLTMGNLLGDRTRKKYYKLMKFTFLEVAGQELVASREKKGNK